MKRRALFPLMLGLLGLLALTVPASAQGGDGQAAPTWGAAWFYDLHAKQNSAVALKQFDTLDNVLGRGWSVDLSVMAGTNLSTKNLVGGLAATKSGPIADRLAWTLGLGAKVENEQPTGWGPVAGVSYTARPVTLVITYRSVSLGVTLKL